MHRWQICAQLPDHAVGFFDHCAPVQQAVLGQFAPDKQIGDHIARRQESQILIDGGDAQIESIVWVMNSHVLFTHDDFASVGPVRARKHLDQSRFARAIIPDQRHNFASVNFNACTSQGLYVTIGLFDIFGNEEWHVLDCVARWYCGLALRRIHSN